MKSFIMLFIFINSVISVGPIFAVPGILSSNLYSTITEPKNFPLCENFTTTKTQIWPIPSTSNDENVKCISSLLETEAFENGTIKSPDGVIIESDPIIKQEVEYFKYFDNVFYVSYDWVHYFASIKDTFQTLKERIEKEVEATPNHEKAFISGYSMGGNFVRYFLSHIVDEEWKSKYIEGAMFFAAGIGGAFSAPVYISINQFFGPQTNMQFFRHMGSLYSMIPNFHANKNISIINGRSIDASQIFDEMVKASEFSQNGKLIFINKLTNEEIEINIDIDDTCKNIYKIYLPYLEEDIADPNVRSLIVYNSGIPVICGANVTQIAKNKFEYEIYNCGGDGLMPSRGSEYSSEHWKNVKYHDFNTSDPKYDHGGIGRSKDLAEMAKDFIYNKSPDKTSSKKKLFVIICSAVGALLIVLIIISIVIAKKKKSQSQVVSQPLLISE